MPENILVVEYEPRYIESVRTALAGQPFTPSFARDGEEAMRAIAAQPLRLVVLSSTVPKISTADLIRAIRGRTDLQRIPILLTVAGYAGSAPKQDAQRAGATDILPKPFTENDFLAKVQQLLVTVEPGTLTSSEIFGDLLEEEASSRVGGGGRKAMNAKDDIDKLLAEKLGVAVPKRKDSTPPNTTPKPKTQSGNTNLDKLVQDTLSGLERKKTPPPVAKTVDIPAPTPIPPRLPTPPPDRIPISYPVLTATAPQTQPKEDEEPVDGIKFGPYVLQEKIATGGMAEVWKARKRGEEGFQKTVAIKKILPHLSDNQEFIEMFIDEAKLAAQLTHNNIIHIYDLGKIQSSYYIAMEYVDGNDLKTILNRAKETDNPLSIELALFIATKIAAALDYAHRKRGFDQQEMGLVHRDVSPQNVLISQEGDIKLCDFGIAKAASKASHTQAGALKGKLQYMSPEQAWGRNIDKRSDIFALTVVLFEMLTGRRLFSGDSEMSILEQVREAHVIPPSQVNDEVTPEIDAIVARGLQKDPAARYQTAGEMAREIDAILYNFKPTPTSADLAIYMHRIWTATPVAPPPPEETEVDSRAITAAPTADVFSAPTLIDVPVPAVATAPPAPVPAPAVAAPAAGVPMPAWDAPPNLATHEKKRSPIVPLGIAAVLVAGIVGAFFYVRSRGSEATKPRVAATATTAPPVAAPTTTQPAVDTAATATLVPVPTTTVAMTTQPPTSTQAALDPNAVALEVQRRLAAERVRLEEQSRAQQVPTAAPPPVAAQQRPVVQPPPQVTQTTAPAPPPVQTATVAPEPVQTATAAPPPQEPAPAPAQAQRVREGDLVPSGTEGLVAAKVLRRGTVPYPPMARAQRVEGTVLLSVLVSERGEVLDVKIIRGINRAVGLNEAAVQSVRRTTFSPPTKDGVRVKAWTTVPVDFKL